MSSKEFLELFDTLYPNIQSEAEIQEIICELLFGKD